MFKNILVPLDGSESSERIVGAATGFARMLDADVTLLHVVERSLASDSERAEASAGAGAGAGQKTSFARTDLANIADKIQKEKVAVKVRVATGHRVKRIIETADDVGADLIAMVTRRKGQVARNILGSVTYRVIRSGSRPVLVVNSGWLSDGDQPFRPDTILVPLDGSALATKTVPVAIQLAKAFGADMHFLKVTPYFYYHGVSYGLREAVHVYLPGRLRTEALAWLSQFRDEASAAGLRAQVSALNGNPANRILSEARRLQNPLIVIATRGLGGVERLVLGSTTDVVFRQSPCPTLVLPSEPNLTAAGPVDSET